MGLPRMIVLKSNSSKKYLIYKMKNDAGVSGFLQFSGDTVWSSFAKFKVEKSKNGGGLVHVRSSYNNKYWVKPAPDSWLVTASADEPQEDQTKSTCTLFKPILCGAASTMEDDDNVDDESISTTTVSKNATDGPTFRLQHVQSKHYICLSQAETPLDACLYLGSANPSRTNKCYDFTVVDWDSLVMLPKHVTFKSVATGKYLGTYEADRWLYFNYNDFGTKWVRHQVFTNDDGSIRLKSDSNGKFWARNSILIGASMTEEETATDKDCLFWPIKLENNVFALRNIATDGFCGPRDIGYGSFRFETYGETMSKDFQLIIEEAVFSRSIYNVDFRLLDARIYNKRVVTMATGDAVNMTDEPVTVDLMMSYSATKSSTWDSSVSLKVGVKTTFEVGVPLLLKGNIEIYTEFKGEYQWGEVVSTTNLVETVYSVTVPAKTRMSVSLLATQSSCDVPFSYDQEDILTDGQRITQTLDGGIYTGRDCYDFKYETVEEKLTV